jgi:hypothetical protein
MKVSHQLQQLGLESQPASVLALLDDPDQPMLVVQVLLLLAQRQSVVQPDGA